MGDFEGRKWHPYLDEETRERRDELIDHLKKNYDGPSDYLKQKLMEEKALSIEERIEKKKKLKEDAESDIERLQRIKKERETQDKLRDKRELLKEKQKKLRDIAETGKKSREEIRDQVLEKMREKAESSPKISDVGEWINSDSTQRRIDRRVDSRLESEARVDGLVEDVQRLQKQVKELNGGEEDYFMDLEKVEEVNH
jgi:chromosome segregation ATPase